MFLVAIHTSAILCYYTTASDQESIGTGQIPTRNDPSGARISAANWSPPDVLVLEFYVRAAPVILHPASPLWLYLGYVDRVPVATAELTVGGGVVGLYGISTLAEHRRRGYGSALTARPLRDAMEAGQQVAILQAAPDGVGVYRRLGFQEFGRIREYKPSLV